MTIRRLLSTAGGMALVAVLLAAVTPSFAEMTGVLAAPQRTVDAAGPDALVLAVAGALAWAVWAWGCLGLVLTAASAVPGVLGDLAHLGTQVLLPAGARRGAAVLLGLGLGVVAPLGVSTTVLVVPAAAAVDSAAGVPDWPSASPSAPAGPDVTPAPSSANVPDWPDPTVSPLEASHVVVRGDCLWHIAEADLRERSGAAPTGREIAASVQAWWTANRDVIGADPDRLLPGQVLRSPDAS